MKKLSATQISFMLCACAFAASIWGSYYCGSQLMQEGIHPDRAKELWNLIYFHFALSQLSLIIAAILFYRALSRDTRYYLIVSYSQQGVGISPPGIKLPESRSYFGSLGALKQAKLPPAGKPTLIFPMMMQSGYSSGERLEREIIEAYRHQGKGDTGKLQLIMQPVLGASPWLAQRVASHLRPSLLAGDALLLVAHQTASTQSPAPEPGLFCRRLQKIFPDVEIALACFGESQKLEDKLSELAAKRIHIIPFLMSEGYHSKNDLPTTQQAEQLGKKIILHPVIGALISEQTNSN